jgi:hypothetical protein
MSSGSISCLEADFLDETDEELKGESSSPPPSYGDDSMCTLDFNCSQTSMFASASFLDSMPSFQHSVPNLDHIAEGDERRRKRPVHQSTAIRSCLKSPKPLPIAKSRARLPRIPSDRPPLTPQKSSRPMTFYSPIRSPDPSPLGGKKPGAVLRSPARRSPARSPQASTGILRRRMFRAPSPSKSPRIQAFPRYSPASRQRKRVTFDLLDEATVGSLLEEESMGFSDLGDDHLESEDEYEASFRRSNASFRCSDTSSQCSDQYFKSDSNEFSFVDPIQLNNSSRGGILSNCPHLDLNSDSDSDSLADNASYDLSENEADDDDENLEASDRLLGKSNELCLAVQQIEQIIEDKPPCFDPPMDFSPWNGEESVALDLNDVNENNSSSESISPTSIASFPDVAGWGEGNETLVEALNVPKFLSETRATPQDLLSKLGLGKESKALLHSARV